MNVSPFRLLSGSTLAAIDQRGRDALRQWEQAWGGLPCARWQCLRAWDAGAALPVATEWQGHMLDNGTTVWSSVAPGLASRLQHQLFGLDPSSQDAAGLDSTVAAAVATDALAALVTGLIGAITRQDLLPAARGLPPSVLLRAGAGTVTCILETGMGPLCWLLPYGALAACESAARAHAPTHALPRVPLVPLSSALAATPVTLSVELARAELTLGYLRTLAVGDVLTLPVKLDQALRVTGPGDTIICEALLGTQDGARAVELVKTH